MLKTKISTYVNGQRRKDPLMERHIFADSKLRKSTIYSLNGTSRESFSKPAEQF